MFLEHNMHKGKLLEKRLEEYSRRRLCRVFIL